MNNFAKVLAVTCLLSIGSTAGAASIDLGTIAAGDFAFGGNTMSPTGAAIVDDFTFTLDSDLLTDITVDSNDFGFFGIGGFTVSSADLGPFIYSMADNAWTFSGVLAAGTYTFDVTGTVSGSLAGQYNVLVGAVPVPAAAWLFGSALLCMVGAARRKKA